MDLFLSFWVGFTSGIKPITTIKIPLVNLKRETVGLLFKAMKNNFVNLFASSILKTLNENNQF